jgi:hypothetical protein
MELVGDERAQSIQIGAVLLFAVLIIAFSSYQAFVIPEQNREVEFNHFVSAQGDVENLRNGVITAGQEGRAVPTEVRLGTNYPARLVATQSQRSSGTIRVRTLGDSSNELALEGTDASMTDVCGLDSVTTGSAVYTPSYNYLQSVGNISYDSTVVYTNGQNSGRSLQTDQQIVQGTTIHLYPLTGTVDRGGGGTASLTMYGNNTGSTSESGSFSLVLPTRLSATAWETELLDGQDHVTSVESISGRQAVRINFDDANYDIRCSPVSPQGPPNNDPITTAPEDSGNVGPAVTSLDIDQTNVVQGTTFDLEATISDSDRGGRDIIEAEWFSNRSVPGGSAGSGFALSPTDGEFDQSTEGVQNLSIDTTGWTVGVHEISVRGRDSGPLWGPVSTTTVTITEERLTYNGDAVAVDGADSPSNDAPGGVEFSVANTFDNPATIESITLNLANSNINELDDQVGGNDEPGRVEFYVGSPPEEAYSEWGTSGGDQEALALATGDNTLTLGSAGDTNTGGPVTVQSGDAATVYLYEFYESSDPNDYTTNDNINMSGEDIEVTVAYTVDGTDRSDTFTVTPEYQPPESGSVELDTTSITTTGGSDGTIEFDLENTGQNDATITAITLDSVSVGSFSYASDFTTGTFSGGGGNLFDFLSEDETEQLDTDATIGAESTETFSLGVFRNGGGNARDMSGETVQITLTFGDGSTETYTLEP